MRRPQLFILLLAMLAVPNVGAIGQQPSVIPGLSAEALAQIDALIEEKDNRSPAQQKIDSQLLYEQRMEAGQPVADGIWAVDTDLPYAGDGHLIVDVSARAGSGLASRLPALGVEVIAASADGTTIRAHLNVAEVETLAADPDVLFVQPRPDATTMGHVPLSQRPGFMRRAAAVARAFSSSAGAPDQDTSVFPTNTGQGSRSSEGDITHLAFAARGAYGARGAGVKIGVLSDGVTNLAASQALGDLGPVTVLPGQTGSGDEGTAMLEIVHDLAPDAQLYFATAFTSITSFAQNIRDLRAAGCDIIVDDVFYYVESPFHDGQAPGVTSTRNMGVVTQAVNDVTADGAIYFSSAGNSGNLNDGTSGTWEGNFADGGATGSPLATGNRLHSFGGQSFDILTTATTNPVNLYWSDPLGASSNDYDLFRLNAAGTAVAASSTNLQTGTQDPYEQITGTGAAAGQRIVIVKKASALPRFLHLGTNRGRLSIATAGETHGHSQAVAAFGVAATPAVGPFPSPFNSGSVVETFSSDGPRRVFFKPDNTPYTPGDFSATGGEVHQKPDITAADGVSVTGVGGFSNPFFGTSAAAPHAAAIAGLLKSANLALTPAQIRAALNASAIDIEAPGVDRDSGAGIIMANAALQSAGVPGVPFFAITSLQASDNPGNGNGAPEAGEGAKLVLPLANYGSGTASGILATLTSSSAGITTTQPATSVYPDLAPSAFANGASPYLFTIAADFPCPLAANFSLIVNSAGAAPQVITFQVPIGPPSFSITRALDGTTPPASPGVSTATGFQTQRIFRDGAASTCAAPKTAFPGLAPNATGNRQFDAYTFNTCANSQPSCVTVTLSGTNAINLFSAAYRPTFNPADLSQNYVADEGASSASRAYAFPVPGGSGTFAIDVHDVPILATPPSGTAYTLKVTGACMGACDPPNHPPVAHAKDVTVSASPLTCGANASIDDGSSDADGDPLTVTQSPAGPYPLGPTAVLLTVTDPKGATSQATGVVTVVDTTAPAVACAAPITVNAAPGACSAAVTFTPTASDACSPPVTTVSTPASGSFFNVGTTTVDTTATDAAGNAASCATSVTVVDNQAPIVSGFGVAPASMWPPNHRMVDVEVNYGLSDNCGASTCVLSVSSNEPVNGLGDGDTAPDWRIIDAHHVQLRAERSGKGTGRVYTITLTCTDASGNVTVKTATVLVPHN